MLLCFRNVQVSSEYLTDMWDFSSISMSSSALLSDSFTILPLLAYLQDRMCFKLNKAYRLSPANISICFLQSPSWSFHISSLSLTFRTAFFVSVFRSSNQCLRFHILSTSLRMNSKTFKYTPDCYVSFLQLIPFSWFQQDSFVYLFSLSLSED